MLNRAAAANAALVSVLLLCAATASTTLRTYDITPDGRRFLIRKAPDISPVSVTELLLERWWFDRLKDAGTH